MVSKLEVLHALDKAFKCHNCGRCCREPEVLKLSQPDVNRLARHMALTKEQCVKVLGLKHYRAPNIMYVFKVHPCPFRNTNMDWCDCYASRPAICQQFPFRYQIGKPGRIDYYPDCPACRIAVDIVKSMSKFAGALVDTEAKPDAIR